MKKTASKQNMNDLLFLIEDVNQKLVDQGLQWGDILGLHFVYLMVHCPNAREEYEDGTNPEFYYGPGLRKN